MLQGSEKIPVGYDLKSGKHAKSQAIRAVKGHGEPSFRLLEANPPSGVDEIVLGTFPVALVPACGKFDGELRCGFRCDW